MRRGDRLRVSATKSAIVAAAFMGLLIAASGTVSAQRMPPPGGGGPPGSGWSKSVRSTPCLFGNPPAGTCFTWQERNDTATSWTLNFTDFSVVRPAPSNATEAPVTTVDFNLEHLGLGQYVVPVGSHFYVTVTTPGTFYVADNMYQFYCSTSNTSQCWESTNSSVSNVTVPFR